MSTTTQTTKTSTGFVGLRDRAVVNDDLTVLALFCALGLLASLYVMTHFPAEAFLTAWL
jgi:hypothetical protein